MLDKTTIDAAVKKAIVERLEDAVLDIFVTLQDNEDIMDGGIRPTDAIELESLMGKMADLIMKVVEYQE